MKILVCFIILVTGSGYAWTACEVPSPLREVKLVEKIWPQNKDFKIVASIIDGDIYSSREQKYQLSIKLVSAHEKAASLIASVCIPDVGSYNKFKVAELESLQIDTAPYTVSDDTTAFGVRVRLTRRYNAVYNEVIETINLIEYKNSDLKPILTNMVVSINQSECYVECSGKSYKFWGRTILISAITFHGYHTLRVKENAEEGTWKLEPANKESSDNSTYTGRAKSKVRKNYWIHFNGKEYIVPAELMFRG